MEKIDPKQVVDIPFHGEDVEGMEAVRLRLVACSSCGGFDFMVAVNSEVPGDIQGYVCSKCRRGIKPETISIQAFNSLMDKARNQYFKAFNTMKVYRFGFFLAGAYILYQTFFR